MKTIHQIKFKPMQFITISGLLLTACLLALLLRQSAPTAAGNNTLHDAAAVEQLKQDGSYSALNAALNATRYQVNQQDGAWRAENPAHKLSAQFTPAQVRIAETAAAKPQWQFGMKLSGYGYGDKLSTVEEGALTSNGNRVEIRKGAITEWYVNQPEGLEQGFTLNAPPSPISNLKSPLRLALQLTGDLRAASTNKQAITLKDKHGRVVLGYDHLAAWDAQHKALPATMKADGQSITLEVDDANAVYPVTIDPLFAQQQKLTAADGLAFDYFGRSLAISGDTAIIGTAGAGASNHAAYVFTRSGGNWVFQAKLIAADGVANDGFGYAVALDGNTAAVGAYYAVDANGGIGPGAVYVFVRSGASWSFQQKIFAGDAQSNTKFGIAVAVSGNTLLAGSETAAGNVAGTGAAYVFTRNGAVWTQQQNWRRRMARRVIGSVRRWR